MPCRSYGTVIGAGKLRPPGVRPAFNAGFTIVELVLVIVIVGILAALAGPRFIGNSTFNERGYYNEIANVVRYAQKVAVATGCPVRVGLTATTYELRQQAAEPSFLTGTLCPRQPIFSVVRNVQLLLLT